MADNPHPQYTVLSQAKAIEPDDMGNLRSVWRIHYESPSGTRSWVDLPAEAYTPRNVHDAITHELTTVERVHALGDGTVPPLASDQPANG